MSAREDVAAPVPVTVIGGYLGAGKTTLVNHLLRQAQGVRLAVLVNDFGTLSIDADLIEGQDGDVIGIAGGCVCCSYGSDLIAALQDLARRTPRPDAVLVETSGVALPGQVAAAVTLLPQFAVDAVVTIAAADAIERLAADPYLADTIARQLADAQIVLLNKIDLVEADRATALDAWLAARVPQARRVAVRAGRVPPAVVLGQHLAGTGSDTSPVPPRGHGHDYATATFTPAAVADMRALAAALRDPALGILRAKGFLTQADGTHWLLHVVGGTAEATPMPATMPPQTPRVVVIGLAHRLATKSLAELFDRPAVTA